MSLIIHFISRFMMCRLAQWGQETVLLDRWVSILSFNYVHCQYAVSFERFEKGYKIFISSNCMKDNKAQEKKNTTHRKERMSIILSKEYLILLTWASARIITPQLLKTRNGKWKNLENWQQINSSLYHTSSSWNVCHENIIHPSFEISVMFALCKRL